MGRCLFEDRATWYFGGGRSIGIADALMVFAVLALAGKAFTSVFEEDEGEGRLEGSCGFGSGGCALSDSATASAAARSAAREASLGVDGAGGADLRDCFDFADGSGKGQFLHQVIR